MLKMRNARSLIAGALMMACTAPALAEAGTAMAGPQLRGEGWYHMKAAAGTAEVYLYGEIGPWGVSASAFGKDLRETAKGMQHVVLRLSSPGGSIVDGLAIYNMIRDLKIKTTCVIDALAASMGSIIALACDAVQMRDNALYMIHNPWTWAAGDAEQLRKQADLLDKNRDNMVAIYARKSGKDADDIKQLMADETWYEASAAKEAGFVDEVIEALDVEARASLRIHDTFKLENYSDLQRAPQAQLRALFAAPLAPDTGALSTTVEDEEMKRKNTFPAVANPTTVPAAVTPAAPAVAAADAERIRAETLAADATRRTAITALFARLPGQHEALRDECLADAACSIDEASKRLLAKLTAASTDAGPTAGRTHIQLGQDAQEKFILGATNALAIRAGWGGNDPQNEFRGFSLRELARASLQRAGIADRGMDTMTMIGVAFTHSSSDFSKILENIANKALLKGAEEAGETFQLFTSKGVLTDFKVGKRVSLNDFPALLEVPEGAEYKHASTGERGEAIQLATYGRLFAITRQAIINDDLSAFTKIPRAMSRAAYRTVGNLVYGILTGNPNMSDGTTLFHATHGNLPTAAALAQASVDAMRVAMALQKDATSTAPLNITPKHLLVPQALRGKAIAEIEAETDLTKTNSKSPNVVRNIAGVIADARLDANSATAWYMLADQNQFDTIEVAYLDGNDAPVLERQDGWKIDGVEFKVRLDAGVKALDWRTMAKNVGA